MIKRILIASGMGLLMMVLTAAAADVVKATPVFTKDGLIQAGPKSITLRQYYAQFWLNVAGTEEVHAQQTFDFGEGAIGTVFFLDREYKVDMEKKQVICKARMRASRSSKTPLGDYRVSMRLLDDGLIEIASEYRLYDPKQPAPKDNFTFSFSDYLTVGNNFVLDGVKGSFPKGSQSWNEFKERPQEFVLCPDDDQADASIGIRFIDARNLNLNNNRISFSPDKNGRLKFILDFRKVSKASITDSAECYSGIDFWKNDKIRMPQYGACRNLTQNPSFEGGLHYYLYQNHGTTNNFQIKWLYKIDDTTAQFGKHSLLMRALLRLPATPMPIPMHTYMVPVLPGERYALSFYAKGSCATGLSIAVSGRTARGPLTHPALGKKPASGYRTFGVDDQWQRYTLDIDAQNVALSMGFGALADASVPGGEGKIWLDGIQLEKDALTPFVEKPVCVQLISTEQGNFLIKGQDPLMRLGLSLAKPGMSGSINIKITDFFGKPVLEKTRAFQANDEGYCSIPMPEVNARFPRGIFIVAVHVKLESGGAFRDILRFSVMDVLANKHRNKNLLTTCLGGPARATPEFDRFVKRWRDMGFGSVYGIDPLDAERMAVLKGYGIAYMGSPIMDKRTGGGIIEAGGRTISGIHDMVNPTDGQLREFEELCALKAAANPQIEIWWFAGECNAGCQPLESNRDAFGKFLVATYRGVKKGNPQAAVLLTGGPCNISPDSGIELIRAYIQAAKKAAPEIRFDGVAGHIYRATPEISDLDDEIAALIAMLDNNGYAGSPIYLNEGMNYLPMALPQLGINPHQGNSSRWPGGPFTYDLGEAERITVAYYARSWLVGFKYQDRVKCMDGHDMWNITMDFDLTAFGLPKAINTLGRLLGNASFKKDIRFAPRARCYVFEDDKRVPVAALWSYIPAVDRGKIKAPLAVFPFQGDIPEVYDLMENPITVSARSDGSVVLPIGSQPIFFVGKPGSLEAMCRAIGAATLLDEASPAPVTISAWPASTSEAKVAFKNNLSQSFTGTATVSFAGTTEAFPLTLDASGMTNRIVKASTLFSKQELGRFSVEAALTTAGRPPVTTAIAYPVLFAGRFTPTMDGNLDEWKKIPFIPLVAGQAGAFNASVKLAWDDEAIYLAVQVKDATFDRSTREQIKDNRIQDAFSIGIDTMRDGRFGVETNFDDNDYCYRFTPSAEDDKGLVFCDVAPGTQADGGKGVARRGTFDEQITCIYKRVADGYEYEIAIPRQRLLPLMLTRGVAFGLSAAVSDGQVQAAPGQGLVALPSLDWRNPQTFAIMTLVD